ncbi:hypothetical protein Godav_009769, partial [Gossypium davidsonii]|nr:hypothetical protein [Gossypium davidsonii]
MTTTRFDIDKFNGITNFNLWQVRMMTILIQSNLEKVFREKKATNMDKSELDRLDKKALFMIQLWLT